MEPGVFIPIDYRGIITELVVALIISIMSLGLGLLYKLWNIPRTQKDMLEELRLMRHTFEQLAERLRPSRHS